MKILLLGLVFLIAGAAAGPTLAEPPLLLQSPTLSKTQIAFAYGDDIWIVGRDGGDATRLVAGGGINSGPVFSPDGTLVAYTGTLDGNADVYVVPAAGGEPRRLTYHPGSDVALGWTPDGKSVLFRSIRNSYAGFERLFTIPADGAGLPSELPLPWGVQGSFSADRTRIAYVPLWNRRPGAGDNYVAIKNYRGGRAAPIWIAQLADSSVTPIPRANSNDFNPMWLGDRIYFLSDRDGPVTLFVYDTKSQKIRELLKNDGLDLKSASAGPGAIVYEQFGSLHLFSLRSGRSRPVHVQVRGDMPQIRPHFQKLYAPWDIHDVGLSPTGARAVLEAHGDIFTLPAKKGDLRNVTHSPAVADRFPSWSPDGKSIAYFSDESGEYALHIGNQNGREKPRVIDLGSPPSFYYSPKWSPDSRKIAYRDKRLNWWYLDLDHPTPIRIDTDLYDIAWHGDPAWSPDSRWLAYSKILKSRFHAIFVYSLETAKTVQVTDGMSDAETPAFDKDGKELYFVASTDLGLAASPVDMTSDGHRVTSSVYAIVLRKDLPSPLAPESDEEKGEDATGAGDDKKDKGTPDDASPPAALAMTNPPAQDTPADAPPVKDKSASLSPKETTPPAKTKKKKTPPKVDIDFDGLDQRVVALPVPPDTYVSLYAGKEGVLYVAALETPASEARLHANVQRFEFKTRKTDKILTGIDRFALSENGEKMLYGREKQLFIVPADKAPKPGDGALKLDGMEVWVDPRTEWSQIYREVWRIERDFFYDPHYHGLDIVQAEKYYAQYLPGIASRTDLNYLFGEMLGQFSVQHMFVGGGTHPRMDVVHVGLLGADYAIDRGRYRFERVYAGENWNPRMRAPLTQPGVNVVAGEYLLEVNGRPLQSSDNLYSFFQETSGKQVVIRVGPAPDNAGSREVTVVPVEDEIALRALSWMDGNRRKVDQLSQGRLAYVYLPNTAGAGFARFNRYYFSQVGREGAVIDERFNGGGQLADYIIDYLRRPLMNRVTTREGEDVSEPSESIYGPKAMIINQFAGSGGDALPWYFRKAKIGSLVGMRTWGGLVGIGGYPQLLDNGYVTAPRMAIYGLNGQWEVENRGVPPDDEVEFDPKLVRQGHDPQLERAVAILLEELKQHPLPTYLKPAYPDYHPRLLNTAPLP